MTYLEKKIADIIANECPPGKKYKESYYDDDGNIVGCGGILCKDCWNLKVGK